ncbi:MAG: iron-containing alcohol dehydrogenase, partial [Halioglobus sp.]
MINVFRRTLYRARAAIYKFGFKLIPRRKPLLLLGVDSAKRLCASIAHLGYRRVLIVSDKPLIALGSIDPLRIELAGLGIEVFVYDGVQPDPTDIVVFGGANIA